MGTGIVTDERIVVRTLLGAGGERQVYLHPKLHDRVIKISRRIAIDRNRIDHAYLTALGEFPWLPKMYGWVETQLGTGLMFDRICDTSGHTSLNLSSALRKGHITPSDAKSLMKRVLRELGKRGIILHDDENIDNFLLQHKPATDELVLVDGFGPFVMSMKARLRMRFPVLAREKTLRCTYNLLSRLDEEIQSLRTQRDATAGLA